MSRNMNCHVTATDTLNNLFLRILAHQKLSYKTIYLIITKIKSCKS